MRAIGDARLACGESRWGDAWRLLPSLEVDDLDVDDLDLLATAAFLTGHDEEGFALWARAHRRALDAGEVHRAAHVAVRLAQGVGFKGDLGRCRGWADRTARLLDEADIDCVERGYLDHTLAMLRVFESGDLAGARSQFAQAAKTGTRFAQRELVTLSRIGEGRMAIYLGELAEGMALLDEAMVSIEAGELSVLATGDAYCTVIDACSELFDVQRCQAWTESFVRWCDTQQELVLYRGHCFLHRAELLALQAPWPAALAEARRACHRLATPVHPMALGGASAIEGDLLRLLGDLPAAEAAYERASEHGCQPQPGMALLRAAQGRVDAAAATIRRVLGETDDPLRRARLLDGAVDILLQVGDAAGAAAAAGDLEEIAREFGAPFLRARADLAAGAVRLAGGDAAGALATLRRAFGTFNDLGCTHDAARARLLLAGACSALGDADGAALEAAGAEAALTVLRSGGAITAGPAGAARHGLTGRELEILRLVASGATNRAIAEALVISERTVASHLGHIFTKLGVTSRSAATAFAYDNELVER